MLITGNVLSLILLFSIFYKDEGTDSDSRVLTLFVSQVR